MKWCHSIPILSKFSIFKDFGKNHVIFLEKTHSSIFFSETKPNSLRFEESYYFSGILQQIRYNLEMKFQNLGIVRTIDK